MGEASFVSQFEKILAEKSDLPPAQIDHLVRYYELVLTESKKQNLTRLLTPADFYEGHLEDCFAFLTLKHDWGACADIGSGVGVPGIPLAIVGGSDWTLVESERRKAEFLEMVRTELGLKNLSVINGRIEKSLSSGRAPVQTVVARALGPVERIYRWIESCSTWNTLVLFKGPSWEIEWGEFQRKFKEPRPLMVLEEKQYHTGASAKHRKLLVLKRVPRGT